MTLRDLLEVQYSTADLDKVPDLVYTLRKVSQPQAIDMMILKCINNGKIFFIASSLSCEHEGCA